MATLKVEFGGTNWEEEKYRDGLVNTYPALGFGFEWQVAQSLAAEAGLEMVAAAMMAIADIKMM